LEKVSRDNSKFIETVEKKKEQRRSSILSIPHLPLLNLQEGTQLDLLKFDTFEEPVLLTPTDVPPVKQQHDEWDENIFILRNSKLLSTDDQEDDNGDWVFSPNIRNARNKNFTFEPSRLGEAPINFDLIDSTEFEYKFDSMNNDSMFLDILSPPPVETNSSDIFNSSNPLYDDHIVQMMSPRMSPSVLSQSAASVKSESSEDDTPVVKVDLLTTTDSVEECSMDEGTSPPPSPKIKKPKIEVTVSTPSKIPKLSSVSTPMKGIDYKPKLFNPNNGEMETAVVGKPKKSPMNFASTTASSTAKKKPDLLIKTNSKPHFKTGLPTTNTSIIKNNINVKNKYQSTPSRVNTGRKVNTYNGNSAGTTRKGANKRRPPIPTFSDNNGSRIVRPSSACSLGRRDDDEISDDGSVTYDDLDQSTNFKTRSPNTAATSQDWKLMKWRRNQEQEKTTTPKSTQKTTVKTPVKTPRKPTTPRVDPVLVQKRKAETPRSEKQKQPVVTVAPESEPEPANKYDLESVILAHSIVDDMISDTIIQAIPPHQEKVILYGFTEIPADVLKNVNSNNRLLVDVDLMTSEDGVVYSDKAVEAVIERAVVNTRSSSIRDSNISAENIMSDEEDGFNIQTIYYYLTLGVHSPLPTILFDKLVSVSDTVEPFKPRVMLKQSFYYSVRLSNDENGTLFVPRAPYTSMLLQKMDLIEKYDYSARRNSLGRHDKLAYIINKILDSIASTLIASPVKQSYKRPLSTPPLSPCSVNLVDISERQITSDDLTGPMSPFATDSPKGKTFRSPVSQNTSNQSRKTKRKLFKDKTKCKCLIM
jgi:hypothetical protein